MDQTALSKEIDALYTLRAKRLAAQHKVDKLEAEEKELNKALLAKLHSAKLEGIAGQKGAAKILRQDVAQVEDEDALLAWGKLKDNRDCIKVGVVTEVWKARGMNVPGVSKFTRETLSVTKVKK